MSDTPDDAPDELPLDPFLGQCEAEPSNDSEDNIVPISSAKPKRKRKPKPSPLQAPSRATYGLLCQILREHYARRLSYNAMRETPSLDGKSLRDADLGKVREQLELEHGVAFAAENVAAGVRQIAEERSFHPVADYLRSLVWDGVVRLPRVPSEILGVSGKLYETMIRRFFVSAVARGLNPGCKVDTSLVLVGPQGYRKSSFFAVLGGEWFCDTVVDISQKDGLMQLAATWIYEWPEIDRLTQRRHASDVKAFLTGRTDTFRPPFGRTVVQHPRACVIVGTTNQPRYQVDDTGSRRFWTVEVARTINLALLTQWRDQLWAEAVVAYEQNEPWWLDEAEEIAREEIASEYHAVDDEDPWTNRIEHWLLYTWNKQPRDPYIAIGDALTLSVLLSEPLKIDTAKQDESARRRVCRIMRGLGYLNPKIRVADGRQVRVWTKEELAKEAE